MPVEMWIEDLTDGGVVYRRAGNLSRGGLYLDQTIPLPIGSKIKLRFSLPDESAPIAVTAQIVSINSRERLGMGVKFLDLDHNVQDRIGSYIERLTTPPMGLSTG
jgi:type IV pilus assembly protein PilZ